MSLPKAVLIRLGEYDAITEEAQLRKTGFATAVISWKELHTTTADWMQLAEILADKAICAWVIAGESKEFTPDLYSRVSLLALSLPDGLSPAIAFIRCDEGAVPPLPEILQNCRLYHSLDPFAAKLMAARFSNSKTLAPLPFHIRAHLDSLIGLWLEICPSEQPDFTIGVLQAEIIAFGIGDKGVIPATSTMTYPILGITGDIGQQPFYACAAQNSIGGGTSCFCKIDGIPTGVFLGDYPVDDTFSDVQVIRFG